MRIFILLIFLASNSSFAQEQSIFGSPAEALSNQSIYASHFSSLTNPATMTKLSSFSVGLAAKSLYTINGLTAGALSIQIPTKALHVGIGIQSAGFSALRDNRFSLNLAKNLHEKLSIGVKANYLSLQAQSPYANINSISTDLGLTYSCTENIELAAFTRNIAHTQLTEVNGTVENSRSAYFSVAYHFSEVLSSYLEYSKIQNQKASINPALQYKVSEKLILRGSFQSSPSVFSFGIAFYPSNSFKLDIANRVHNTLGHSPSVSLGYVKE